MILESARLAGDDFATRPSLLTNGIATMLAAVLGSPFPTTLYIGHAAHKANGARSGYSVLNGALTCILCLTGILPLVLRVIPIEVAGPVIVWFGLMTVGQAFTEVPQAHAVAVAMGLLPLLAQWASTLIDTVLRGSGTSLAQLAPHLDRSVAIGGIFALAQGALLISMLWAASMASIVDRRLLPPRLRPDPRLYAHARRPRRPPGLVGRPPIHPRLCSRRSLPRPLPHVRPPHPIARGRSQLTLLPHHPRRHASLSLHHRRLQRIHQLPAQRPRKFHQHRLVHQEPLRPVRHPKPPLPHRLKLNPIPRTDCRSQPAEKQPARPQHSPYSAH